MTLTQYIRKRGLIPSHVAQKLGVTRQTVEQYGNGKFYPTLRTIEKIARAMTDMGCPTTVADISAALIDKKKEELNNAGND